MKNTRFLAFGFPAACTSGSARNVRFSFVLSTLLTAAALLGPGGGFRAAAQFPIGAENETTVSVGVFQVTVTDPNMIALMNPDPGVAGSYPYAGWITPAGPLTSPLLADFDTRIAISAPHIRSSTPAYFSVDVGASDPLHVDPDLGPLPLTIDSILGYYAYLATPADGIFDSFPVPGHREALTEIQKFNLGVSRQCNVSNANPLLPPASALPAGSVLARAGYDNLFNGPSGYIGNYLRQSIGQVVAQSTASDFPADSFFDIYVEITLPPIANSMSEKAFPLGGFPHGGAVLTNEEPLIVESVNLPGPTLPPTVVYNHTPSSGPTAGFATTLRFRDDGNFISGSSGPRYYYAGDAFGTIVLAGHGAGIDPCAKSLTVNDFLQTVLGPSGQLAPRAIVGRTFVSASFPSPNSSYASVPGTNAAPASNPLSGTSIDEVMFTNGATILHARDFVVAGFANPIALPAAGDSVIYTNPISVVTLHISTDGKSFVPAQAVGQSRILISNINPATGSLTSYATELLSLDVAGTSGMGNFSLRESPTKASVGKHLVQNQVGGTYKIGGNINAWFDYSFNNGLTWKPASRSISLEQSLPVDCGAATNRLSIVMVGASTVKIAWANATSRLQGTSSLDPGHTWVDLPFTSPYIFDISSPYHYFRLVCP
jgi:hypothetical protein